MASRGWQSASNTRSKLEFWPKPKHRTKRKTESEFQFLKPELCPAESSSPDSGPRRTHAARINNNDLLEFLFDSSTSQCARHRPAQGSQPKFCQVLAPVQVWMKLPFSTIFQISVKRGPASRFVIKANTEALVSKSNSRRSEYVLVRGQSIWPWREYQRAFGQILNTIWPFLS